MIINGGVAERVASARCREPCGKELWQYRDSPAARSRAPLVGGSAAAVPLREPVRKLLRPRRPVGRWRARLSRRDDPADDRTRRVEVAQAPRRRPEGEGNGVVCAGPPAVAEDRRDRPCVAVVEHVAGPAPPGT